MNVPLVWNTLYFKAITASKHFPNFFFKCTWNDTLGIEVKKYKSPTATAMFPDCWVEVWDKRGPSCYIFFLSEQQLWWDFLKFSWFYNNQAIFSFFGNSFGDSGIKVPTEWEVLLTHQSLFVYTCLLTCVSAGEKK